MLKSGSVLPLSKTTLSFLLTAAICSEYCHASESTSYHKFLAEARQLIQQNQIATLEHKIREQVKSDPDFLKAPELVNQVSDPGLLILFGTVALSLGKPADSLRFFQKAASLDASSYESLYGVAQALYAMGNHSEVEAVLERCLQLRPNSFEAYYLLGACRLEQKKPLEVILAWRSAHQLRPDSLSLIKLLAIQYLQGQYYREAVRLLAPAVDRYPQDVELQLFQIQALHNAMDYIPSLEQAKKTVEHFPNHPRANLEFGIQLYTAGRFDESRRYFKRALALDRSESAAKYYLGDLALKEGSYEEATSLFKETLEKQPDNMDAYMGMAKALIFQKQYRQAVDILYRATAVNPNDARTYLQLSKAYEGLGEPELASLQARIFEEVRQRERGSHEMTGGRSFPSDPKQ
jgi:tetratricopeptide (TPR) repeat protein